MANSMKLQWFSKLVRLIIIDTRDQELLEWIRSSGGKTILIEWGRYLIYVPPTHSYSNVLSYLKNTYHLDFSKLISE